MNRTPNWKDLKLANQCGSCKHYGQFIKDNTHTARGTCNLNKTYKQRTDTCKKYVKGVS